MRSSAATCSRLTCDGRGYRTLLDIGGSTGVVADAFARRFDLRATVVDPAPLETAQAQALGIETIEGLVEDVDLGDRRFDVVVLCQTVDHLLDVSGTLRRVRELLAPAACCSSTSSISAPRIFATGRSRTRSRSTIRTT